MKVKHLLMLLGVIICVVSLRWFEVFPFSNNLEDGEVVKPELQLDASIPTPDQLWEQQKRSNEYTPKTASALVPQRLLEIEAKAKEQMAWDRGYVDENDIPPADPDRPYVEESQQIISATEPDMEVLPSELIDAERKILANQEEVEIMIPTTMDPVELLQAGEIPSEPPEMEALPEELMNLEYAAGSQL